MASSHPISPDEEANSTASGGKLTPSKTLGFLSMNYLLNDTPPSSKIQCIFTKSPCSPREWCRLGKSGKFHKWGQGNQGVIQQQWLGTSPVPATGQDGAVVASPLPPWAFPSIGIPGILSDWLQSPMKKHAFCWQILHCVLKATGIVSNHQLLL